LRGYRGAQKDYDAHYDHLRIGEGKERIGVGPTQLQNNENISLKQRLFFELQCDFLPPKSSLRDMRAIS
jgi:hypothetical protein